MPRNLWKPSRRLLLASGAALIAAPRVVRAGSLSLLGAGKPSGGSSTLKNGLISFYQLEEASGTRFDATANALDLTEAGTVSQITGKVGFGAGIGSTSNILFRANNALYNFSGGMSLAFWVQFPSSFPGSTSAVVAKQRSTNDWRVQIITGTNVLFWQIFDVSSGSSSVTSSVTLSTGTWYFCVATADNTNLKISINDGTKDSSAQSGAIVTTTEFVRVGDSDFAASYWIDQLGIWNRALTSAEITQLYNSGSGLSYAAM